MAAGGGGPKGTEAEEDAHCVMGRGLDGMCGAACMGGSGSGVNAAQGDGWGSGVLKMKGWWKRRGGGKGGGRVRSRA